MTKILTLLFLIASIQLFAQDGYRITVNTSDYASEEIYLGFYLGESQYVKDTASSTNGTFVFKGDEALIPGFYIVVFPPDNQYCQLLINEGDHEINLEISGSSLLRPESVAGSPDTEMFYDYADYITDRRPRADEIRAKLESTTDTKEKEALTRELEGIDLEVKARQERQIRDYPNSLTTLMIKSQIAVDVPEFEGSEEEKNEQIYDYYKEHYFDNIALSDPRIARTPFIGERITYYMDKLTVQQPDSIASSIDYIMGHFDPDEEPFQIFLVSFLNKYAKSKIVGMDAVYVHIVDNYYANGLAPWTEEDQLAKIIKNANTLRPILIGKTAPDLKLLKRDKTPIMLHEVEADYTVLFFWDPECGHCKKSIPHMIEFYEQYHGQGVEILAVCTKLQDGEKDCWDAVDDRGMDIWLNASDPYLRSRFKQIYDVRLTPQIFILDADKKIIMKKIGAEQLPKVMDHFLDKQSD